MGAACDVVVYQPLALQGAQEAQHAHVRPGEEDVVDHTLEVVGVVGVRNQVVLIGAL